MGKDSSMFWDYVRAIEQIKPRRFLFENVASMKRHDRDIITETLGVEPIYIDSALVSAQMRKRLYWTNIPGVEVPEDRFIMLNEILQTPAIAGRIVGRKINEDGHRDDYNPKLTRKQRAEMNRDAAKSNCLTTVQKDNVVLDAYKVKRTPSRDLMWYGGKCRDITGAEKSNALVVNQDRWSNSGLLAYQDYCRYLTPVECERLQGLPDGYTEMVVDRARYRTVGLGWQTDTVAHILNYLALNEIL